jgi:glucan endo-1,3-beta-D-glucosidase
MLQAGASNQVISAIQAAIDTDTTLLLGLWASQNQDGFNAELGALQSAITQFGEEFTSRVVGISVGSEDLYRISPTGILNESGIGQSPDTLVSYINQVRELIGGGPLANAPIGHVDTWTAWVNGSNSAVVNAVDWLGTDAYPYFQNTEANGIENGGSLFFAALDATRGAAGGKPVWVTETGW